MNNKNKNKIKYRRIIKAFITVEDMNSIHDILNRQNKKVKGTNEKRKF